MFFAKFHWWQLKMNIQIVNLRETESFTAWIHSQMSHKHIHNSINKNFHMLTLLSCCSFWSFFIFFFLFLSLSYGHMSDVYSYIKCNQIFNSTGQAQSLLIRSCNNNWKEKENSTASTRANCHYRNNDMKQSHYIRQ